MNKLTSITAIIIALVSSQAWANKGMMKTNFNQIDLSFSNATHADTKVSYYGGPVISNVKIHTVLWGSSISSDIKDNAPDFYTTLAKSNYMDLATEYSTNGVSTLNSHQGTNQLVGRGTYGQTLQITPSITETTIDDSQIQQELERQILAGTLPAPTDDSLYMISFPDGVSITIDDGNGGKASSCQAFCAFHEGFKMKDGRNVFYGVMPDLSGFMCSMGCGSGSAFDRFSVAASHEVMEAVSDGFPTPGSHPDYPQAWNTTDGQEIGDLCQSNVADLTGGKKAYKVQEIWSNKANACTSGGSYSLKKKQ